MTDPHGAMSAAAESSGAVSYREVLLEVADASHTWQCAATHETGRACDCHRPAALRALAGLVERITEAVATDERALTLTDPSARASEQQYAEDEINQAAVSIAAGFQPEGEDR